MSGRWIHPGVKAICKERQRKAEVGIAVRIKMWKGGIMQLTKISGCILLAGLLVGMQWFPVTVSVCHGLLAVIQIDHSDPEDITSAVSVLLTPDGRLSFDRRTHSLVVNDTPQVVAQVRALINRLDRPAPGLEIRVRLGILKKEQASALSVEGRASGPGWSLGTAGRADDGLDLTLNQAESGSRQRSEYVLKGQSGRPAYIVTGRDIPFTARWHSVCSKFGGCRNQTTYKRVETGFEVRPLVRGQYAVVHLTPRISSYEAGVIRFAGAATQIRVPLGRWVDIGMQAGGQNEALSAIVDSSKRAQEETFAIWMMIKRAP